MMAYNCIKMDENALFSDVHRPAYMYTKIKKPVHASKKPSNEQVQRQFLKTSKNPVKSLTNIY